MILLVNLLRALQEGESVYDLAWNVSLVGILIVFAVLLIISMAIGAFRFADEGWKSKEKVVEAEKLLKEQTIDNTTLVLITATAAAYIGGRFMVTKIRRVTGPPLQSSSWAKQGRTVLHGSHVIYRK